MVEDLRRGGGPAITARGRPPDAFPPDPGVDRILAELPAPLRSVAEALRRRIRTEAPGLRESVKWGSPVWNGHGDVLCLMVYPHWVHLGLFQGAALAELFEGIEGTGKRLRHVRVPTAEAAGSPEIGAILRAAVALDASGELPGPPPARRTARRGTAPRRP